MCHFLFQVQYTLLVHALLSPRLILNMFIFLLLSAVSGAVRCEGGNVCVSQGWSVSAHWPNAVLGGLYVFETPYFMCLCYVTQIGC